MNCQRAQELFSDYRDGSLASPLSRELAAHLEACPACDDLYRALCEVADALGSIPVPRPRPELTEKLVAMVPRIPARPAPIRRWAPPTRRVAAASWLAVAAALLAVMITRPPELATDLPRAVSRSARHVYSFALQSYHQTERWLEDLNVLRMTVVVAFEDRIDQLNEQLRDLAGTRREPSEGENEQSRDRLTPAASSRRLS